MSAAPRGRGRGGRGGRGGKGASSAERPTHFLAIPLNNHPVLRNKISTFTNALLANQANIPGLDETIIVDPIRLHFTLGVMHLRDDHQNEHSQFKTVAEALALLRSLRPQISQIVAETGFVNVDLDQLDLFTADQQGGARVLFVGPSNYVRSTEDGKRLVQLSNLVHSTFKQAGFITETRPLKLHCTILNTSWRKPHSRLPFYGPAILASSAALSTLGLTSSAVPPTSYPLSVTLGQYTAAEIGLWVMGTHGPNNEYLSLGGVAFT